jgi:hypothetical protein
LFYLFALICSLCVSLQNLPPGALSALTGIPPLALASLPNLSTLNQLTPASLSTLATSLNLPLPPHLGVVDGQRGGDAGVGSGEDAGTGEKMGDNPSMDANGEEGAGEDEEMQGAGDDEERTDKAGKDGLGSSGREVGGEDVEMQETEEKEDVKDTAQDAPVAAAVAGVVPHEDTDTAAAADAVTAGDPSSGRQENKQEMDVEPSLTAAADPDSRAHALQSSMPASETCGSLGSAVAGQELSATSRMSEGQACPDGNGTASEGARNGTREDAADAAGTGGDPSAEAASRPAFSASSEADATDGTGASASAQDAQARMETGAQESEEHAVGAQLDGPEAEEDVDRSGIPQSDPAPGFSADAPPAQEESQIAPPEEGCGAGKEQQVHEHGQVEQLAEEESTGRVDASGGDEAPGVGAEGGHLPEEETGPVSGEPQAEVAPDGATGSVPVSGTDVVSVWEGDEGERAAALPDSGDGVSNAPGAAEAGAQHDTNDIADDATAEDFSEVFFGVDDLSDLRSEQNPKPRTLNTEPETFDV